MSVDLHIRGGLLADGSGDPPRPGDVLIHAGRIVDVGHFEAVEASKVIDARGQLVAPGFIDIQS